MRAECAEDVTTTLREPAGDDCPRHDVESDSFLKLLTGIEHIDRSQVVSRYQAWIERNEAASIALHCAWFNLGVELAGTGDKAGAIDAYQKALVLRPGFYPAAINLGTLLEATGQPEAALAVWEQALQPDEARTALLDYRGRLLEASRLQEQSPAVVLHVGCGAYGPEKLPPVFRNAGWREIRLDIDPEVQPDVVASVTDMHVISNAAVDAVYASHNLEHLYSHDVPLALKEMHRVLKPNGCALIMIPDLQEVARHVAAGRLEDPLYVSPMGPIAPLDILFGHRASVMGGNTFMAHRTGFTGGTLGAALIKAGFAGAMVQRDLSAFALTAVAFCSKPDTEQLAKAQAQMLPAADQPAVLYSAT